jgi:hypothetical protein
MGTHTNGTTLSFLPPPAGVRKGARSHFPLPNPRYAQGRAGRVQRTVGWVKRCVTHRWTHRIDLVGFVAALLNPRYDF